MDVVTQRQYNLNLRMRDLFEMESPVRSLIKPKLIVNKC